MIGQTLGNYQVNALLGKGGMGEVYRARDQRLDRDVAIKILPREMSGDPERVLRFQREARSLATLQHPNVASIYGFEDLPEARFLIMELVEGQDLAERMAQGPLPVDECVAIGIQICEGLAAAHERGIVHRDLKPANIKLMADGTVKILDFGLARAYVGDATEDGDLANSPTITAAMTAAGVILGTAAYMAPEQARGRPVDQRADIWALGVILWEMLAGSRLFDGETVSDTLAAVLKSPVEYTSMPPDAPPALQRIVERCLERSARERFQHAGDVRWALEHLNVTVESASLAAAAPRRPWAWMAATFILGAVALFGLFRGGNSATRAEAPPLRKSAERVDPESHAIADFLAPTFSPDGTQLAYAGPRGIMVRRLNELEPRLIAGTEGGRWPAWSPDGGWICFSAGDQLLKIPATGGATTPVLTSVARATDGNAVAFTPAWQSDGFIYLSTASTGIYRVSDRGGSGELAIPLTAEDSDLHAYASIGPELGGLLIVHVATGTYGKIDLVRPDGSRTTALDQPDNRIVSVVWSPTGHILYEAPLPSDGIWALPFDPVAGMASGAPFLVAAGGSDPTVSKDGVLAYIEGSKSVEQQLVWVDRSGDRVAVIASVNTHRPYPDLSADGSRAVLAVADGQETNLVIFDTDGSGVERQLTFGPNSYEVGSWSPDDSEILTHLGNPFRIERVPLSGTGGVPVRTGQGLVPIWTPDGKSMVYTELVSQTMDGNLMSLDLTDPDAEPKLLLDRPHPQWFAQFSPDGRFLAYESGEAGPEQVYVSTWPGMATQWRVSRDGGSDPHWSADGSELCWTTRTQIMSSHVTLRNGMPEFSPPRPVFTRRTINWSETFIDGFDMTGDAQRFIVVEPSPESNLDPPRLVTVQSWIREFE